MPFYTFICNSCGHKFEVRCTIAEKDSGSVVCPGCGANELDRIFEGFSISVKGGAVPRRKQAHARARPGAAADTAAGCNAF
jgi:putative FmdB family regulatory protein